MSFLLARGVPHNVLERLLYQGLILRATIALLAGKRVIRLLNIGSARKVVFLAAVALLTSCLKFSVAGHALKPNQTGRPRFSPVRLTFIFLFLHSPHFI